MNPVDNIFRVSCLKNINTGRTQELAALSLTLEAREDSAYSEYQIFVQVRITTKDIHCILLHYPQLYGICLSHCKETRGELKSQILNRKIFGSKSLGYAVS